MKKPNHVFITAILFLCTSVASGQTVTSLCQPQCQFFDSSGNVLAAGTINTYAAGTTNALATYTDNTGGTPNANPITLNSAGMPPAGIFLTAASYKFVAKNSLGVTQWTADGYNNAQTLPSTLANLTVNGPITQDQPTAATGGANQSSFLDCIQARFWNGAASAVDKWCWQDVLGTGTNPTTTLTLTHTGTSGQATINLGATLANFTITAINTNRIMVDQEAGADNGAKYNKCITDLATLGGICDGTSLTPGQIATQITNTTTNKIVLILPQGESWGTTDPVINDGAGCMSIVGQGNGITILKTNAVGNDIIKVGASSNSDCTIIRDLSFGVHSSLTRTGGAAVHLLGGATIFNIGFPTAGTYRGIWTDGNSAAARIFNLTGDNGNIPLADNNGNWLSILQFGPVSSGTNTGSQVIGCSGSFPAVTDAFMNVDGGTDSLQVTNCDVGLSSQGANGRIVHIQKSVGADPTWTKITNSHFEGGASSNCVQADAGQGTELMGNWIALCQKGIVVNAGSIKITGGQVQSLQQDGIAINGGTVKVVDVHITNNGQSGDNTYDDVVVAANVNNFAILDNDFSPLGTVPTNKEKFAVEVKNGTSNGYTISNNDFTNSSAHALVSDGGSGTSKKVCNAGLTCTMGSSQMVLAAGSLANPSVALGGVATGPGLFMNSSNRSQFSLNGGTAGPALSTAGFEMPSTFGYCQSTTPDPNAGTRDSCMARKNPAEWAVGNGTPGDTSGQLDFQVMLITATAFASLGTPANGAMKYCNDCTVANPCAGGGTGALAKRLNGAWVCN